MQISGSAGLLTLTPHQNHQETANSFRLQDSAHDFCTLIIVWKVICTLLAMAEAGVSLIPSETLTSRLTPPNLQKLVPTFRGSSNKLQKHSSRLSYYKRIKSMRLSVDQRRPSSRAFAIPTVRANGGLIPSANPMALNMTAISHAKKFREEEEKITTTTSSDLSASNGDEDEASNEYFVNTVNAVLADFVDGQKYLKETGRTTPRPMKRRALIVCLALGGLRKHADEMVMSPNKFQRTSGLRSNSSSSFATTWQLASQVSFGASKHVGDQTNYTAV